MKGESPQGSGADLALRAMVAARLLGLVLSSLLRLERLTWRVATLGMEHLERLRDADRGVLVTFWHGKYPALFGLLPRGRACVFASRSFRGAVIAEVCRRSGFDCVLIAERSRGGALELMVRALGAHRLGGIAVDGPLGPRHQVKTGAVRMAAELGWSLLPVSMAARPCKILQRRWDRMEVPCFFSRVALVAEAPLAVRPDLSRDEVTALATRLHDALERADRRAEALVAAPSGRR